MPTEPKMVFFDISLAEHDDDRKRRNMAYKNPSLRRIQQDILELQREPSPMYYAAPLEEDMFLWHFTIRGPPKTDFDGGIYHGEIHVSSL